MQYLSKAYNYYSGINPATLSGAIDVVVVRSVDENGEETLAASPFHVRFGKLQVLRAGDKRVTLRLPNNLPPPHVAPFNMKVGETGEAFFVLETEEDVPAELLTSPVVQAADHSELPLQEEDPPPPGDDEFSRTNQPFGATEQRVSHKGHKDGTTKAPGQDDGPELQEVEPFDLNAPQDGPSGGKTGKYVTPSSLLPTSSPANDDKHPAPLDPPATSNTFLTGDLADKSMLKSPEDDDAALSEDELDRKPSVKEADKDSQPRNPLEAGPGESTKLPLRNHRLSNAARDSKNQVELPKVKKGAGDGPPVLYGKDIVLDMGGYHKDPKSKDTGAEATAGTSLSPDPDAVGAPEDHPAPPKYSTAIKDEHVEELVNDLMASTSTSAAHKHDLSVAMGAMSLDESHRPSSPTARRAFDRAKSEPPGPDSRPSSPSGDRINDSQMDLAWDWAGPADEEGHNRPQPHRGESLPVEDRNGHNNGLQTLRAKLTQVDDDPFTFMLQLDDRVHLFELSLCGSDDFAENGKASLEERWEFDDKRITFNRFEEDQSVVDDPRLIVRYKGLYLSWSNAYHLLFALTIFRRSMPGASAAPKPEPARAGTSGYFSRWWRKTDPTGADLTRVQSAPEKKAEKLEPQPHPAVASATVPSSEVPSPSTTPATSANATPVVQEPDEIKHYAKTLRLTSDQLKQLNLKPGPNTVQFSVSSSYSGYAVVTARIFLWESTDQIIISDIDGTITKSDALGHLYAAIGRDWTHGGIANLYTDICNNGYKMIYLTARAIGQSETTREYLKTIVQGEYRMPEGPVIMSPDRLMASLHREVILRKPELFKMACLRDIQRLFGKHAKDAFFAGFGNRITDAMSYRSVGIESGKIYTIDSTGVILTELLQGSHKGSYVGLNHLVNEVFPPVKTKNQPEYTDFNYWRDPIPEVELPDLAPMPVSPALSARSDTSGASRLSMLGKIASLGRRGSRSPPPEPSTSHYASFDRSHPSSPLIGPAITPGDLSEEEEWTNSKPDSKPSSMPGSFNGDSNAFPESWFARERKESADSLDRRNGEGSSDEDDEEEDYDDDDAIFDDDILATGEMANVPF